MAGRPGGGAAGRRAVRASDESVRGRRRPSTGRGRSIGCGANLRKPRGRIGRRAPAAASRSRVWRCCAWPRGNRDAAAAAIRRLLSEVSEPADRAALLPAYVEIMLATGDVAGARDACAELGETADRWQGGMLAAMAARARGAVALAEGDAPAALVAAARGRADVAGARSCLTRLARARVLTALACRALGDEDSAVLELEAARAAFAELGAGPDLAQATALADAVAPGDSHGLTARELEVLRLIAAGNSNRAIAAELVISEHTVARHTQNIFAKLGVSSRTAASAFAFSHDLV